jgi:hypothetical protein
MPEYLNQLLADSAMALVRESFTGVSAPWWWERRLGGGIEVCQEFDPETASREISAKTGGEVSEVRRATPLSYSPNVPQNQKVWLPGSTDGSRR